MFKTKPMEVLSLLPCRVDVQIYYQRHVEKNATPHLHPPIMGVHDCHLLSIALALAPGSYKQEILDNRAQMGKLERSSD